MPLYEFVCDRCGTFEQQRSVEAAGEPVACPSCGEAARRSYSAPGVVKTRSAVREAHLRNERSVHEPERVARPPTARKHGHGGAHGRPWQIGH